MLTKLGQARGGESLVELLMACHERIRRFSALAIALAESTTASRAPAEIADGADAVRRYFEVALPLHAADEDLAITPRLARHAPALVPVLAWMHADHVAHRPLLDAVIELCAALARTPAEQPAIAPRLAPAAAALAAALIAHVDEEERTILPAIASLPAAEQAAIVVELRARRATAT